MENIINIVLVICFIVLLLFGFIVFSVLIINRFNFKKNRTIESKYGKLSNWSYIFLSCGVLIISFFGIKIMTDKLNNNFGSSSSVADGFIIEGYEINLDVNESNIIDVKEYITVNFYEEGHHGIYRFIPSWLEYTSKDGVTQSRKSKISNLMAVGDNYTIDTVGKKKRIKIGDEDNTLSTGLYTYEITYTYHMGADPYNGFDELIFHAFGDYWGTPIKNAAVTINMPNVIGDENKIKFFADKYRRKDITSYVDYYVDENTIHASLSKDYDLNSALTIDIELPDGYFVNGSNNYGIISLVLCVLCILMAVVSFILWIKRGKDLDNVPETVEFYPPNNMDAAEIGYLYKQDSGLKLSIALIVELASKGFIKIIESEDKMKRVIVKSDTTDVNIYIKRKIKIVKLKEYREKFIDTHQDATRIMKKYLPKGVNENTVTSNFDEFYVDSKYLVDNGYIKIESDSINEYSKKELDAILKKLSSTQLKDRPKMSSNEEIVYNKLFEDSDEIILSENQKFYETFTEIRENINSIHDDEINDLTSCKYMLISSIGFFICTLMWGLSYFVIEDLTPNLKILYLIAFALNIVTVLFSFLMKRKNLYGEQIISKINGFKKYIELAEKSQIEMLVEKNPNYFYDILPYAYVLGVSKKWIEKFENIPKPTNDMGDFDFFSNDSLDSLSDSVYIPSSSSSSGGCGGGGGCSSCGGGGSW